jgi:hypothetical protein
MALPLGFPQRDGSSSGKTITIIPPSYFVPLNSLFVVLPFFFTLLSELRGQALEARREQIGNTFASYSWDELVAQACGVYEAKQRTLRNVASLEGFLAELALIQPYHTAARHASAHR